MFYGVVSLYGTSIIFGRCGCCAWFGKAEINRRERFDTREAITKDQMRKFLKFVHDDNVYCKYYEVFYILFHTGLRISEFCGLTIEHFQDAGTRYVPAS